MNFTVSVVIPAFNVARFIEKAVQSALNQEPVIEVLVIDDGSLDHTKKFVMNLQMQDSRIVLLQHENGLNKGRSASRNLGIQKAAGNFVAFLDADDFYLDNRFNFDQNVFNEQPEAEGVYNAVGYHFYREPTIEEKNKLVLDTLNVKLAPNLLFDGIVSSKNGLLHLNGITVKKRVFQDIGLFNEDLMVGEDSDLIFKLALKCNLEAGLLDSPVALRGIHEENIFNNKALYKVFTIKIYESVLKWSFEKNIPSYHQDTLLKWLWFFKFSQQKSILKLCFYWLYLIQQNHKLMRSTLAIKYFPIVRLRQDLFPMLFKR